MGIKLLVACTDISEASGVIALLRREYPVFFADDFDKAVAVIDSNDISIVFADLKFTRIHKNLLPHILKEYPQITRILLGEKEDDPEAISLIQKNLAKVCLIKPWDTTVLGLTEKVIQTEKQLKECNLFSTFVNLNELPTINSSYLRILQLIDNDGEMNDIADAIGRDPTMAAKMLRVANSSYFGLRSTSIKHAVVYLGMRNIRDLVISSSVFEMFNANDLPDRIFLPLWQQSFLCSKIAGFIYRLCLKKIPSYANTAGLLMKIGMIFLLKQFGNDYLKLIQMAKQSTPEVPVSLEKLEVDAFSSAHSAIGGYLLNWWGIPYPIVEAVIYQNDPFNQYVIDREFLAIMHIASYYSAKTFFIEEPENKTAECFELLGISMEQFEQGVIDL